MNHSVRGRCLQPDNGLFAIFDVKTTVYAIAIVNFLFSSYTVFTQSDEHVAQFLGGKYNEEN